MNRIVTLFLLISTIVFVNYEKIERFVSSYKAQHTILTSTDQLFASKKKENKDLLINLYRTIDEESMIYNNKFCNKYSNFYKVDHNDAFVEKRKTYIVPETSKGGVYSVEQKKCVHSYDPLFTQQLDCNKRLTCKGGMTIHGSQVMKQNKNMCVYDCI